MCFHIQVFHSYRITNDGVGENDARNLQDKLKEKLNDAKSKLDAFYDTKLSKPFRTVLQATDPGFSIKNFISSTFKAQNCSNAWPKCYELVEHFDLLPDRDTTVFCNAEFPGSFIFALNHYSKTRFPNRTMKWYGSSLIEFDNEFRNPLHDTYKLWENYPDNWLMSKDNDGDVTKSENQWWWKVWFEHEPVDLYMSDLGFDVSSDFNKQEYLQIHANFGQIIAGLITLKKGGSLVTKQYSFFEKFTVGLMAFVSQFFDEFYITKPMTSRDRNSETYIVGKGFRGIDSDTIDMLLETLDNFDPEVPLDVNITDSCLAQLNDALVKIFECQVSCINFTISTFEKYANNVWDVKKDTNVRNYMDTCIKAFKKTYHIRRLRPDQGLVCYQKFGRR